MMTQGGTAPPLTDKRRAMAEELAKARQEGETVDDDDEPFVPVSQLNTGPATGSTSNTADPSERLTPEENVKSDDTCKPYLKGECQFGLKGKNCPDLHPKPCKEFMKWGDAHEKGCKNGVNDENEPFMVKCGLGIHSSVCPNSLSLKCETKDCPYKLHTLKCRRAAKPRENASSNPKTSGRHTANYGHARPPPTSQGRGGNGQGQWRDPWARPSLPQAPRLSTPESHQSQDFHLVMTIQKALQASLEAHKREVQQQIQRQQTVLMENLMKKLDPWNQKTSPGHNPTQSQLRETEWPALSPFF